MNVEKPGYFSKNAINDKAANFYAEYGYLVVHDAFSKEDIQSLNSEAVAVCRQERGTLDMSFRKDEFDRPFPSTEELRSMPEEETLKHFLCIHQPHKTSDVLRDYLQHPSIVNVLTQVVSPNVKCMQSMLFIKAAGKPGQAWHQDEDFIPTRDRSLIGAWIAMDDAVIENGCLWIIPGSHKPGILWPMYPHDDKRYDCAQMAYDFPYKDSDAIPVEVPSGAVVFFNGYTLHKSEPNKRKSGFRRVLVNHYMSAESLLPWKDGNNLSGPVAQADYRDIVLVAGKDPYAWKGTEEMARPHIRAAGEGGCGDGRVDLETYKKQVSGNQ